eukprot:CAMPEP_0117494444 /NCGR_PEP_ID=MMETSP0784-20121206/19614_1 /TAXON_ID=39447 /ORGANISM="" /LENGTH=345 /DNA_ID=CAMNT_0005289323 /DNA_START=35 /DNA_END=1072 /DNA_ORIENTATION=-
MAPGIVHPSLFDRELNRDGGNLASSARLRAVMSSGTQECDEGRHIRAGRASCPRVHRLVDEGADGDVGSASHGSQRAHPFQPEIGMFCAMTTRSWQNSDGVGRSSSGNEPGLLNHGVAVLDASPPPLSVNSFPSQADRNAFYSCKNESEPWDCLFESADDVEQDSSGVVPLGFVPVGILLSHRAASQDTACVHDNMEQTSYKMFRSLIRKHHMDAFPSSTQESHHRTSGGAIDMLLGLDRHSLLSFLQRSRSTPLGALVAMRWLNTQTPLQHDDDVVQRIHDFLGGERYSCASTFATCGTRVVAVSTRWAPPIADLPGFTIEHDDEDIMSYATSHSSSFSSVGMD